MQSRPRNPRRRIPAARTLQELELTACAVLVLGAAGGVPLLSLSGLTTTETAVNIVGWTLLPPAAAFSVWLRRQRKRRISMAFEDVRDRVDAAALRSLRAGKGEMEAVKELRRQEPRLSVADAQQLLRRL